MSGKPSLTAPKALVEALAAEGTFDATSRALAWEVKSMGAALTVEAVVADLQAWEDTGGRIYAAFPILRGVSGSIITAPRPLGGVSGRLRLDFLFVQLRGPSGGGGTIITEKSWRAVPGAIPVGYVQRQPGGAVFALWRTDQ